MTSKTIPPEDEKLLPCPWCGAKPAMHENDWCDPPEMVMTCSNIECLATRSAHTPSDAISAWNRRSTQPDREAIIEKCALIADEHTGFHDATWRKAARLIALEIRSLKHSDTTPDGGKNG